MLFPSRSFAVLSLGALLLQAAPKCTEETPPPEPVPYALHYRLELNHTAPGKTVQGLPDAVTFRAAMGHELTHVVQQGSAQTPRVIVRGWDPVKLAAAEVNASEPFVAWRDRVAALGTCPEGVPCDPAAEWAKSGPGLSLDGTLTALTDDGQWLFRYTFFEGWPTTVSAGPTVLLELGLASRAGRLEWNPAHPFFEELKAAYSVSGDQATGLTVRDEVNGEDLYGFRAQVLGIDEVLRTLDNAFDHPGLTSRRVAISGRQGYATGYFVLELDGVAAGWVDLVGGLSPELEVVEEVDPETQTLHRRPGKAKYKNITLRRGTTTGELLEEYKKVLQGMTERKSGSIIYLDRTGSEVLRYHLTDAFPTRWSVPHLNARSDAGTVEEVEVAAVRDDLH